MNQEVNQCDIVQNLSMIAKRMHYKMGLPHLYGITSDRQLCDEIGMNIGYRWFVGLTLSDAVPNHSSLTRIRDRLGVECFAAVFEHVVEQCRSAGLVEGKRIITDASLVEANALAQKLERPEQPAASVAVQDEKQQSKAAVSQTAVVKSAPVSNRTHVSPVDCDATLVNRPGYPRKLYHKVHYCVDASSRVITDCYVTTGACHEGHVITPRIQYQQERFGFPIEEVIADAGYSSGKTSVFEQHQICSYIPTAKCRSQRSKQEAHEGSFKYDTKQDIYTYQAGHALEPKRTVGSIKYYYINKAI